MDKKLIAVYGTLKQGFGNNRRLGDSKLLGSTLTKRKFTMYSCGGFPAVTPTGETKIHIEVYEVVNPNILQSVYMLEGYSGVRDSVKNWYDTVDVETPWGKAEMFIFKTAPKGNVTVQSGNWGAKF